VMLRMSSLNYFPGQRSGGIHRYVGGYKLR
jgi:hypothetical protein